ncbi:MAG: hypothetical protein IPL87_02565 [Candidatus Moraniibacteriota bacterium]|nr:MAG: hypothetical protein IPL87_02565 [Candidatus Moranbacteria bacterium]
MGIWFLLPEWKLSPERLDPMTIKEAPLPRREKGGPATNIETSNWKTYRNESLKLSFKYPNTFRLDEVAREDGHVVSVMEYDENKRDLYNKPIPGYSSPVTISYWRDLNDPHLGGGDWAGKKQYSNFEELIGDTEHTYIKVKGEMFFDRTKAYVVSLPGYDFENEAIMFEYAGGYYQISFPWTNKRLDETRKKEFLSSIKLLE